MAANTQFEKYKSNGTLLGGLLEWVDARFPATATWRAHLAEYYAPKNFNFWYFFGSLALLVLVIQIVTGIFLVMNYKPDASLNANGVPVAFASVSYIMNDVNWGWLIRYIHSTGASAFFIVVYLHMFRGILYGSYRKPRELVWIFGILIFLCLMAEAFMGYLLPWGQMSLWGAQVIVNLFGAIPLIGEPLSIWVRGDFVIGDATLNRFFSFHVIAVPLVLLGLVVAHLLALHEVGSNNPDGVEIKKLKDEKGIPLDGIPFHPYYTVKDIVGVTVFLMFFFAVVCFAPEGGGYFLEYNNFFQADPMKTPPHIAPVWYFTPFYSMLRAMVWNFFGLDAKFWGVVAMGAGVVILAFLPWLDRAPVKSIRYRGPIFKVLLAIFVVGFLILGYLGTKVPGYYFFGYTPATDEAGKILASPLNYLLSGDLIAQVFTVYYFLFFLTMPWWSRIDRCKPEPERLTWK
ncbi:MAG: cytochrome bc complex cytochrome b subunit [Zoogloeaceae bacterium]|jgi:ubiquinol-cytochrome c reductase cytochrome b subunit|nr:cytochrome bc complex cytochrome b subunit [Zoogloeaceae bacterium]